MKRENFTVSDRVRERPSGCFRWEHGGACTGRNEPCYRRLEVHGACSVRSQTLGRARFLLRCLLCRLGKE